VVSQIDLENTAPSIASDLLLARHQRLASRCDVKLCPVFSSEDGAGRASSAKLDSQIVHTARGEALYHALPKDGLIYVTGRVQDQTVWKPWTGHRGQWIEKCRGTALVIVEELAAITDQAS
jgi:hypothetical protein